MKVVHWCMNNRSGMHAVAESMARAELLMGVEAKVLDPFEFEKDPEASEWALDADVHVGHTHIPDRFRGKSFKRQLTKPWRVVFPVHGTPELIFEQSVESAKTNGYGSGRSYAGHQIGMQNADAILSFVPRQRDLLDLATDRHTIVDLIPMGIDTAFWSGGESKGKYVGAPSFFNCENAEPFKWAMEVLRVWPWIYRGLGENAALHIANIPTDVLRFVDGLALRNGSLQGAYVGSWSYDHDNLRNILKSVDYYISTVRYGDFNRISLEAGAAGLKVISYTGNEYADFWMPEGDQRNVAKALIAIGNGEVEPRVKPPIPTEKEMGEATVHVYERILDRPQTNFALGEIPDALTPAMRDAFLSTTGPGIGEAPPKGPRPKAPSVAELQAQAAALVAKQREPERDIAAPVASRKRATVAKKAKRHK